MGLSRDLLTAQTVLVDSDVEDGLGRNKEKKKKKNYTLVIVIFISEQAFPCQTFPLAIETLWPLVRGIVERILKQISHGAPAGRIEDPGIGFPNHPQRCLLNFPFSLRFSLSLRRPPSLRFLSSSTLPLLPTRTKRAPLLTTAGSFSFNENCARGGGCSTLLAVPSLSVSL